MLVVEGDVWTTQRALRRQEGHTDDIGPGLQPSLDDLLSMVGARGKPTREQRAALQSGLDSGLFVGAALDTLRSSKLDLDLDAQQDPSNRVRVDGV